MVEGKSEMRFDEINVAICDDDENIIKILYNHLEKYEEKKACSFNVSTYLSGEELLESSFLNECDLLLLDIEMCSINGIELAHIIRENLKENLQIIFISSYDKYMKEMFDVHPFNYLTKPISENKFFDALDKYIRYCRKTRTVFTYKVGREIYRIKYKDILYFESTKRIINIYAKEDIYSFYGKLDEVELEVLEKCFYRIHQSYLVNPEYIRTYSPRSVTLENGFTIPISAKYKSNFLQMQVEQ